MEELNISENERILIIAPHPDDECIGAGGILLKYSTQCNVVVMTDGRQGQGDTDPEEGKRIRRGEFAAEMERLEIKNYRMLDIEDGTLLSHIEDGLKTVDLREYDRIFVTGMHDAHADHKAAFLCVMKAAKSIPLDQYPRCYLYEVHTPILSPTHFLDITDILQEKCELIRFHISQLKDFPYDELARQCAEYRGTLHRMPKKQIEVYQIVDLKAGNEEDISETDILLQKERLNGWCAKQWVRRLIHGKKISDELFGSDMREIYIYGYGELGKLLLEELKNTDIKVKAVVDRRAEQFMDTKVPVISLREAVQDIPVVVTAVYEYSGIAMKLKEAGFKRICSIRDLLEGAVRAREGDG